MRYDLGWKALNTMLKSGRSLSGHERNCCFLNTAGAGRFADVSAAAGLDFDDDGRVLALTDWDLDGDLDFWVANRSGPQVRFLRNDHGNRFPHIAFLLEGVTCNRDAVGARVELHLAGDGGGASRLRVRTSRAGDGYLAQSSRWLHFGLGAGGEVEKAVVRWPDGAIETLTGLGPGQRYTVRQGEGRAVPWEPPVRQLALAPSEVEVAPSTDRSRILLIAPVPIPRLEFSGLDGAVEPVASPSGRPRLINLWATWCAPCLEELRGWGEHRSAIEASGLEVVAVNVDEPEDDTASQRERVAGVLRSTGFPFAAGYGTADLVALFDVVQSAVLVRKRPMPVPTSFLIDGAGDLRAIYKGPVGAEQLVSDVGLLGASPEEVVEAGVPYAGRWLGRPAGASPNQIAVALIEGGFVRETEQYLRQLMSAPGDHPMFHPTDAAALLGALLADQGRLDESASAFELAVGIDPDYRRSRIELAAVYARLGRHAAAASHYEKALERRQDDPELWSELGLARLRSGATGPGADALRRSLELRPAASVHYNLGNAYIALGRPGEAAGEFERAVALDPDLVPAANNLAWLLATNPDTALRDGRRAVELAERVCGGDAGRTASNFDTLAAAYAESGRFDEAVEAADEAIRLAKAAGELDTARGVQQRKSAYLQGRAHRDG